MCGRTTREDRSSPEWKDHMFPTLAVLRQKKGRLSVWKVGSEGKDSAKEVMEDKKRERD